MKKYAGIAVTMMLLSVFWSASVQSDPRTSNSVDQTYRDDGNRRIGFNINVTSNTWISILPERSIRRSATLKALASATFDVCLSTSNASGLTCAASGAGTHQGLYLEPGDSLTDFSEGVLYGLAEAGAGNSGVRVFGFEYIDNRDQ